MTTHVRIERLVAQAIDFELSAAEQQDVAAHLAMCPTCRALAAGYRSDAAHLHAIAFRDAPERVRVAVLGAVAVPARRAIHPWRVLAAAVLLLASLVGAAIAIGAFGPRPALTVVLPSPSPSARPTSTPLPSTPPAASVTPAEPTGNLLFFRGVGVEGQRNGSAWFVPASGPTATELGPAIEASWAGDGRTIHLVSQDQACIPTLTTVTVDSPHVEGVVSKGLLPGDGAFAWSPDGQQVVFIRWHTGPPAGTCGSQGGVVAEDASIQDVILMQADGSGQRVLVPTLHLARPITWSPDGTRIAYTTTISSSDNVLDPVVVSISDGSKTPLARTPLDGVSIPRWSPDGNELAFLTYVNAEKRIGVITVDGGELRDLGSGDADAQEPSWSPDGRSIAVAFDIATQDGVLIPGGIAIHCLDGGSRRELSLPDVVSFSDPPAWSPDGTWLAYISATGEVVGSDGVALVGLDGSLRRTLPGTAGAQWVAWQPAP